MADTNMKDADPEQDELMQELQELRELAEKDEAVVEEPPRKKAKTIQEEVIFREPVAFTEPDPETPEGGAYSSLAHNLQSLTERHSLAPEIPVISEIALPTGYRQIQNRKVTDGISAGRSLVELPTELKLSALAAAKERSKASHEQLISKLAEENPAPFAAPPNYHMKKAGVEWADPTLAEWNPNDFRIFVGDIGPEVTEETLRVAFSKYPSFLKAKIIMDKRTGKSRGYGFVSYGSPQDYLRVMKEMQGQYVGNRPVSLRKSTWKSRIDGERIQEDQEVLAKKAAEKQKKSSIAPALL